LFLVDPGIRIISTANVPPQQKYRALFIVLDLFSLIGSMSHTRGTPQVALPVKRHVTNRF
jgi:hypothetical protein